MKLAVEESEFIQCDVLAIRRYLSRHNPSASAAFIQSFVATCGTLVNEPGDRKAAR